MIYVKKENIKNDKIEAILFLISIIFLLMMNFVSNEIFKLILYTSTYLCLTMNLFYINKFNVMSVPILFTVFHALFIGLCPIFVAIRRNEFYEEQYNLILISYFLFCITNYLYIKLKKEETKVPSKEPIHTNTLTLMAVGMTIVGMVSVIIYVSTNFNVLFGGDLEAGRVIATQGNGLITHLSTLGIMGICILFELTLKDKFKKNYFIVLLILTMFFNVLSGFRSRLIAIVVLMILIYNKERKLNIKRILTIGAILLILICTLGILRDRLSGVEESSFISTLTATLENGSVNLNRVLEHFPEKSNYKYGYTYLINIIMLRPGPDLDFTLWLKEEMNMTFSGGGVTPTLVGEFYINFGYMGAFIGFSLMGIIAAYLDRKYEKLDKAYYISVLVWCFLNTTRGGIANVEISLILYSLVYFVIMYISKRIDIIPTIKEQGREEYKCQIKKS